VVAIQIEIGEINPDDGVIDEILNA